MLKTLNASEERLLFRLLFYLEYRTNFVCERGQRLNLKRIEKLADLKKTHLIEVVNSLELKGIIFRIPDGRHTLLMLNAAFAFRGSENDRKAWEQLPEVIQAKLRHSELIGTHGRTLENADEPAPILA
jgi:predicted transcriptional regulator of viral defense system